VHYGHLRTALEVKEIFSLDSIHLVPCAQPVHKKQPITTAQMRFEMLHLAIQNTSGIIIDKREIDRKGPSYMVETLKSIRAEIGSDIPLLLFIGMDAFKGLSTWYQWISLFEYSHIVVMTRPRYSRRDKMSGFLSLKLTENKINLAQKEAGYLFFQPVTQMDISSSNIREIIDAGQSPKFLLPDDVINYIRQNNLYI
ncbi:MAG: nicotinate-nucleotide adenylyltransferase, partial [Mycoplasmataceae bacterium]|nr:nicotinate-nucleotide adenylyltransferase [Mycoplasmataceae bacterium]